MNAIPEYCDDCAKLVHGVCITYENPCLKVGLGGGGGGAIGCAFSPLELPEVVEKRIRVGQQKGKKKS